MRIWSYFVRSIGDVVSSPTCAACDAPVGGGVLLCGPCLETVQRLDAETSPWAIASYGGAIASVLLRLKYGGRPDLGPMLGELLGERCVEGLEDVQGAVDAVVPVPVPYERLVERGYNQAALIAGPVARRLEVRFIPRALRRRKHSKRQAQLGRQQRLDNLKGAFEVCGRRLVDNRRILLVDDVSTTGATLSVCREALMMAGAASVRCAVVARTERFNDTEG